MPSSPLPLSQSEYARHRGVAPSAVRRAITAGRLVRSIVLVRTKSGRDVAKIRSAALADEEWDANTDERRATRPTSGKKHGASAHQRRMQDLAYRREKVKLEIDLAKLDDARRDSEERAGRLIPVEVARADVERVFAEVRSRLMAVPSKARQSIATLTPEGYAKLDALIREALEELADEDW